MLSCNMVNTSLFLKTVFAFHAALALALSFINLEYSIFLAFCRFLVEETSCKVFYCHPNSNYLRHRKIRHESIRIFAKAVISKCRRAFDFPSFGNWGSSQVYFSLNELSGISWLDPMQRKAFQSCYSQ